MQPTIAKWPHAGDTVNTKCWIRPVLVAASHSEVASPCHADSPTPQALTRGEGGVCVATENWVVTGTDTCVKVNKSDLTVQVAVARECTILACYCRLTKLTLLCCSCSDKIDSIVDSLFNGEY